MTENDDAIELDAPDLDEVSGTVFDNLNGLYFARWCYDILSRGGNRRACEVVIASAVMQYAANLLRRRPDVDKEGFLAFCSMQYDAIIATEIEKPSLQRRDP